MASKPAKKLQTSAFFSCVKIRLSLEAHRCRKPKRETTIFHTCAKFSTLQNHLSLLFHTFNCMCTTLHTVYNKLSARNSSHRAYEQLFVCLQENLSPLSNFAHTYTQAHIMSHLLSTPANAYIRTQI